MPRITITSYDRDPDGLLETADIIEIDQDAEDIEEAFIKEDVRELFQALLTSKDGEFSRIVIERYD
jgi:Ca2+-binding EF-hand superfamily protein